LDFETGAPVEFGNSLKDSARFCRQVKTQYQVLIGEGKRKGRPDVPAALFDRKAPASEGGRYIGES